jgi:2-haloacid dehalogenase
MTPRFRAKRLCVSGLFLALNAGAGPVAPRFKAVAFDYFVLFDANSVVPAVEKEFPGKGAEFAKTLRGKQFEYCFLRSITHQYRDFFQVTGDALVYTAHSMSLDLKPDSRKRLLNAYLDLNPWPDAAEGLRRLRAAGVRIITIANFSSKMLKDNARHAGIEDLFDELLSTEGNQSYKPENSAYGLGLDHLGLKKQDVVFAAFGAWDYYGAKTFGYPTYWVNRFHLPAEELGAEPDGSSDSMEGLLRFVLGEAPHTGN